VIAALIPEDAIVVDESVSTGRAFAAAMMEAAPHDRLNIMGGSIGLGAAVGVGAAIGAPARKVLVLEGDGSAMYTLQALWTMAREGLGRDRGHIRKPRGTGLLQRRVRVAWARAPPGAAPTTCSRWDRPHLDWVALARGHGRQRCARDNARRIRARVEAWHSIRTGRIWSSW
jgi:acetolactate synthase-1/2/3 large subunit